MQVDLGQPGDGPQDDVLDARLGGGGDRDRIAVAAQPGRDPEDVNLLDGRRPLRLASVGDAVAFGHACQLLSESTCEATSRSGRHPDRQQILGNCSPDEHRDDPLAADDRPHGHHARMFGHDLADDGGVSSQRDASA